ncbi:MAG: DUF1775 domain-containing protein [Silicimonas sp.]|nr:DUF1775 domain-containing protein [Silicimonas sp.]
MKHVLLAAAALSLTAFAADAHATLEEKSAVIGKTTKLTLRVPHGCKGEATHTVRIEIPEGFYAVKPMPKAGWTLETETGAYETSYINHGRTMTEGVRAVIWSGGDLQNDWYDEFVIRGAVGPNMDAGGMLYFPAVQTCATGTADWTDTSGSREVPNPAPKLKLVAGDAGHGHGSHGGMDHKASLVTAGALEITGGFSRETLPNQPAGGGFMTVTNTGTEDDQLVAATSPASARVEIHEMKMDGDVMRMRELAGGLPIPAGETVMLKPGGYHLMFMGLTDGFTEGEMIDVMLTFERAGDVAVKLKVGPRNAKGHGHMKHGN